ncbi:metal ABC transporter substrate-binding protein [Streptomyces sp. TP-A0874]|uniref:metal ABC transporter substrate-binding protein n=1 Tax=Streptomyces sp. TP-A0874 TaxID=549819 RepID=UPI000852DAD0|nr:zinc ABC transporter substrate-binding protein [Streptomyces sp. TP-A0874]
MNVRPRISTTAVAAVTLLGLTALSACSTSDAADAGKGGRVAVVASFYPLEFLAEQIGGEFVDVTTLTAPGVEPHDLELTPRQTGSLQEADLIVYLGKLQPAVDKAVEQSDAAHTVDAGTLTERSKNGTGADKDPHIWLDPRQYAEMAAGVGEALGEADPEHAGSYEKNADALVSKLRKLDQDFESGLKNRSGDTIITAHAAFGHLAERYGLRQEAVNGIDPESEPSPARVKELHKIAAKEKSTTVFFETIASQKTARTLAADTGLRTDVLDPVEGVTDASRGQDYLEIMRANLSALQKALDAG